MICESMATAVTEHICSKMIQLFNVSTSIKISRNYVQCCRVAIFGRLAYVGGVV